jgi:hypothetical protein
MKKLGAYLSRIFLLIFLTGCFNFEVAQSVPDFEEFRIISIHEAYPIAEREASIWHEDFYLEGVMQTVVPETEVDKIQITFSFRSPEFSNSFLLVTISESEKGLILDDVLEDEFPIEIDFSDPIFVDSLTIGSHEAFEIFFDAYGSEFYLKNDDVSSPHFLKLEHEFSAGGKGKIIWSTMFRNFDESVWISLDADTGEIIEVRGVE